MHFQVCRSVLLSGLWDLKDTLKSQQNRSKNILVGECIVIREYGSCSLPGECTVHSVSTNTYVGINQSPPLTLYTDYYSFKIFLFPACIVDQIWKTLPIFGKWRQLYRVIARKRDPNREALPGDEVALFWNNGRKWPNIPHVLQRNIEGCYPPCSIYIIIQIIWKAIH